MPSSRLSEIRHDFDGVIELPDGKHYACDIVLRLPTSPAGDAAIEARARGVSASGLTTRGVTLRSTPTTEAAGLHFLAEGAYIREAWTGVGTHMRSSASIEFAHMPSWQIQTVLSDSPGGPITAQTTVQKAHALLSPLRYGVPNANFIGKATGERVLVHGEPPHQLRFRDETGANVAWQLDTHWSWTREPGGAHRADATKVLRLQGDLTVAQVEASSDDACTLLSLAARHRVVVQTLVAYHAGRHLEIWNQPLARQRGLEEESAGCLVDESELEPFFEKAHAWWWPLSADQRDAVRLAVFAINPLVHTTIEQEFTAKHFALEGLLTRWGKGKTTVTEQLQAILGAAPSTWSELWQVGGANSERPIRWLRNELSHGRQNLTRLTEYVSAANDHVTLWLELVLLALIGFQRGETKRDKLRLAWKQNPARLSGLLAELRAL